mmetsp:Transcript_46446/g.92196  ORF Transcript_46446/g.92196 Transcript_46446/m.92196 type:complete len:180 (-) Transcript_46446:564-1103(-)
MRFRFSTLRVVSVCRFSSRCISQRVDLSMLFTLCTSLLTSSSFSRMFSNVRDRVTEPTEENGEFEPVERRGLIVGVAGGIENGADRDGATSVGVDEFRICRGLPEIIVPIRGLLCARMFLVRAVGEIIGVAPPPRSGVDPADTLGRAEALPEGEVCRALGLPTGEAGPRGRPRGACGGC